jgi:hypothetical protein
VFTAYFDDSGTHDGSPNTTVGGFLASVDQWQEFERLWNLLLYDYGLEFFHMSDYESRFGVYKNWDNPKRIEFMQRLTGIIRRTLTAAIAATFPSRSYARIEAALASQSKEIGMSAVEFCVAVCWKNIGAWADAVGQSSSVRVASIFEEGDYRNEVLTTHARFKNTPGMAEAYRLGGIGFDDKTCMPLQAADFFAYETHKRVKDIIDDVPRWRKSVGQIVSAMPIYASFLGNDRADEIVANFKQGIVGSPYLVP